MPAPPPLDVHFLPQFVAEHELAGGTVIVIDLLRASTTVTAALAAGAIEVRPFTEVAFALQAANGLPRADMLLGGERGGKRIEGFDLGNSPTEYSPDVVFGKRVFFTTTNGTWALEHARLAERTVMGCLWNLSAVVAEVLDSDHVHVLCAGTGGNVSRDDLVAAGAYVEAIAARRQWQLNEPAESVRREWQELANTAGALGRTLPQQVVAELHDTPGGRNLLAIGHDFDLTACAEIDRTDVVPLMNRSTGALTAE